MIIRELKENYPLIYRAALDNQIKQGSFSTNDELKLSNSSISGNFDWDRTTEGNDFWFYINDSNFDRAKKLRPHLFKIVTKFEVGKWYKSTMWDQFIAAKFLKINDYGYFCYSERINIGSGYKKNQSHTTTDNKIFETFKEVELSDIQKYLPDGHKDKLVGYDKKESLLNEAKEKYPVGSEFIDLVNNKIFKVKTLDRLDFYGQNNQLYIPVEKNDLGNKTARIYKDGVWAEVVNKKSEHMVGRYIKALCNSPEGGDVKKGECGIITENFNEGRKFYADFPSQSSYVMNKIFDKTKYEIMPEDFGLFTTNTLSSSTITSKDYVDNSIINRSSVDNNYLGSTGNPIAGEIQLGGTMIHDSWLGRNLEYISRGDGISLVDDSDNIFRPDKSLNSKYGIDSSSTNVEHMKPIIITRKKNNNKDNINKIRLNFKK